MALFGLTYVRCPVNKKTMNVRFKNVSRNTTISLMATVGLSLLFAGCSPKDNGGDTTTPPMAPPGVSSQTNNNPNPSPVKIAVYIPMGDATDTKDVLMHPVCDATADSPAKSAIVALTADQDSGFPTGTHLLSIKLKDAVATVDFNQVPVDLNGGEGNQQKALNSILMTLGQFESISSVQILVNGSPVKEGPQFPMDAPLDVIRPGQDQQAQAPEAKSTVE